MTHHSFVMEGPAGPEVQFQGRSYLYFAGTGYFSLQSDARLTKAADEASRTYGTGSATSRNLAGTTPLLLDIEKRIAGYFGTEDAAFLPSGYLSNLAGLKALSEMKLYDVIFLDERSHYSLSDGAAGTGKPVVTFKHRSPGDLLPKVARACDQGLRPLAATDALFPVMGQLAPLDRYLELMEKHDGLLWVDDAHGVGILGKEGRGSTEHFGLKSPRLYMGATLSKAFGAHGGIIPGDSKFISRVKNGPVLTGSSPPMNAAIGAGLKGLELVRDHPEMRQELRRKARILKAGLRSLNIPVEDNELPMVAFTWGRAAQMEEIQHKLYKDGIFIQYTRYQGSGPEGVLRIVVFSNHSEDQIHRLISSLKNHLPGTS